MVLICIEIIVEFKVISVFYVVGFVLEVFKILGMI